MDWARRMMGIATPLIAALDRAVPHSAESPRPSLFWSVASTGPERGGLIEVSAGFNRWALLPQANGWLLFPPPPREMPALPIPEQVLATVWTMLAAHDQHVRARGAGTTSAEERRLFLRIQALVRTWVLAHDPELAPVAPNTSRGEAMASISPTRIAQDGLRALLTLPPNDVDGPLLRDLLIAARHVGEAALLERVRALGAHGSILIERAAAALTPEALIDAAAWAGDLPEPEQRRVRSAIAPWLMRHARHQDLAQRLLVQIEEEAETASALNHTAVHMPEPLIRSWIGAARVWIDPIAQGYAMAALLRALAQRGPAAARLARAEVETIRLPFARALALALVLTRLTGIEQISAAAHELRRDIVALAADDRDALADLIVVPLAESGLAATAIDLAGRCDAAVRDNLLERIVDTLKEREPAQALVACRGLARPYARAAAALRVAAHMTLAEQAAALGVAWVASP